LGSRAYLGPDYSAEYLHRLSEVTRDTIAVAKYGRPFARLTLDEPSAASTTSWGNSGSGSATRVPSTWISGASGSSTFRVEGAFELFATVLVAIMFHQMGVVSTKTATRLIFLDAWDFI